MKHCNKCGKDTEEWGANPWYCKPCLRKYYVQWRAKNPERSRKAALAWYYRNRDKALAYHRKYDKENPEQKRRNRKKWQERHGKEYYAKNAERLRAAARGQMAREQVANPERVRARRRADYARNRERISAKQSAKLAAAKAADPNFYRKKYAANREYFISAAFKMKAKRRGASGSHSAAEWKALLTRHENRCAYCSVELTPANVTRDHVVPLCRGGSNDIANIVPACRKCNFAKHRRTAEEFSVNH